MSNAAQGRLAGRRAVVTGAGLGIGRAIALRLAAEGCDVGVFDRSAADSQETARLIASAGRRVAVATGDVLLFLHADVGLPADALAQVERALAAPDVVLGAFRTWTVADAPSVLAPLLHLADLRSRRTTLPYGDQAMFLRAEVFRAVGGFPTVALMEDLALSMKLRSRGRVLVVPARVRVSGRRFLHRPLFYAAIMGTYPTLFRLGVPPTLLARFYGAVR